MLFAQLWKGNPRNLHPPIPVSGYLDKSLCIGFLSQALQDDGSPQILSSMRIAEAWVFRLGRSKCHSASFMIDCDVQHGTVLIEGGQSTLALLQKGFTFVTQITSDCGRPSESSDKPTNEPLVGAALKKISAVTMHQARFTCAYIYCTGQGMQHETLCILRYMKKNWIHLYMI